MACPDENVLLDLATGRLEGPALEAAEEHLDGCARCRRAVAELLRESGGATQLPPRPPVGPGTCIGRYVVIERVGAGATGQVLAAYDPQLDRKVALKLLKPQAASEEHRARLAREAQTLARLAHPNVVTVFDVGTWSGQLFIALEFVAGGSASAWVARHGRAWRDVVRLYVQAGRGLAAAHEAGVVHRDFKPDNVLVHPDGRAQVTDFGLAGQSPEAVPGAGALQASSLTHSGALLGTPAYMAPDQLLGKAATAASDQFGFCVALYEALYGQKPYAGDTVAALVKAQQARALSPEPPGAAVPAAVRRVVLRGLEPDEAARFPSMSALVAALEQASQGTRRAGRFVAGLLALSVLALVVGVALGQQVRVSPACALASGRYARVRSPATLGRVREAFAATKLSYAEKQLQLLAPALDARAQAWSAQALEACEASHGAGEGAALWHTRLACLDERFGELASVVDVLSQGSAETVTRAVRVAERLPGPLACVAAAEGGRYSASKEGLEQRARATARAATALALVESGRFKEAEELSRTALADGGFDDPLARAALQLEHARAQEELGALDESQAELLDVAAVATGAHDAPRAGWALVELAWLTGWLRAKPNEGAPFLQLAEAHAPAARDRALYERLAAVAGTLEVRRGRLAEAEQHHRRAEELVRLRLGEQHPARARALSNLAQTLFRQRKLDEALPLLEQSYRLLADSLGEEHPDTFQALNAYGAGLGTAGRLEGAAAVFQRVLDGYRRTLGANHPRIGTAARNLGEALARLGRHREALTPYAEALQVFRASLGPDTVELTGPLAGVGEARLQLGEPEAALDALREGVRICDAAACEADDESSLRVACVRALLAVKRPGAEVRAQGKKALAALARLGPRGEPQRKELEALLAARGR
jgi:tetratricopeptide (TPR) repeat protein